MNSSDVLAVVVSYNGLQKIRLAVEALRNQVRYICIVDNGSRGDSLSVLASLEEELGVIVERLGENKGVGYALNRGVQRARELGCNWLLTMDQDSVVDRSFMAAYQAAVENEPELVSLTPRIMSRTRVKDAAGGVVNYAITSGNLVRVSVFDHVGLYDESFFIDAIDFDFCLRIRRRGHEIRRVAEAQMQHQLGESLEIPKSVRNYYALHSPVRRYYMYRNFMYLMERHVYRFPGFIAKLGISQLVLLFFIAFLDPSPWASYRAIFRGLFDYMMRRQGPYLRYGRCAALKIRPSV